MPPKKKGTGKRSAKGKKAKEPEKVRGEPLNEQSKEFYQLQIRDLEDRLERYQKKWDEITAKESLVQAQYGQLASDKKEIVSFLKRTLNQRMDEIADLNEQLVGLQQAKDAEKDTYEAQLAHVRHEFQETKDRLTSENMLLAGKLASLEEFRVQKEELTAKFAALEEKLRKQEEDHKEMIYKLEKKGVLDKDRLKKEMVQRVNTVAAEFRRVSNNQMAETTKRAIRENVSISSQLAKMSDKSMELIHENDCLKERVGELRKELEVLEESEQELVKTNLSNQKVIQMLKEKCQQQRELLDSSEKTEQDLTDVQMKHQDLQEEAQSLRRKVSALEEELQKSEQEKKNLSQRLDEERRRQLSVERVLGQAAVSLKDVLLETPREEDEETEVTFLARRNQMLQNLLQLLDSAATLGLGPKLHDFRSKDIHLTEHNAAPKDGRFPTSPEIKGPGVLPHYRMGDLGLVPRQDAPTALLGKIGMLSKTTRLGPLRGNPNTPKNVISLSLEEKQIKPTPAVLPGIPPSNKTLLVAK
ncbi:cilia- and flagella-associated protein 157 isoform X1 [Spea bombifrons]|uniref:cilia- and flagella-associated protein 157 isoform X1 n=1 Tax=Spea bombifrons TaxID=233779 RepID=UPI002349B742|nr:cilia- and flagella-associated protein 157 isoform X1 [Spea bombifrons]